MRFVRCHKLLPESLYLFLDDYHLEVQYWAQTFERPELPCAKLRICHLGQTGPIASDYRGGELVSLVAAVFVNRMPGGPFLDRLMDLLDAGKLVCDDDFRSSLLAVMAEYQQIVREEAGHG